MCVTTQAQLCSMQILPLHGPCTWRAKLSLLIVRTVLELCGEAVRVLLHGFKSIAGRLLACIHTLLSAACCCRDCVSDSRLHLLAQARTHAVDLCPCLLHVLCSAGHKRRQVCHQRCHLCLLLLRVSAKQFWQHVCVCVWGGGEPMGVSSVCVLCVVCECALCVLCVCAVCVCICACGTCMCVLL